MINKILEIAKHVPQDKWNDDQTIRKVIRKAAKESGKAYTDEEIDQFAMKFKKFIGDGLGLKLMPILLKKGMSSKQLESLIKKWNK